jgi:DDE superfamily endonuclease
MTYTQALRSTLEDAIASLSTHRNMAQRMVDHAMALAQLSDSRTISHVICARGHDQQDWSAEYKMFSRSQWDADRLFDSPLRYSVESRPEGPVVVVLDDTKLRRSGAKIPGVTYQRDPMSPPFHTNNSAMDAGARTLPVCFREVPVLKKPGKRASKDEIKLWKEQKKEQNLSKAAVCMIKDVRQRADRLGAQGRKLLSSLDGSFCNKTVFSTVIDDVELLARCRTDAKLAFPAKQPNRVYDAVKFTPKQVRQDKKIRWKKVRAHYGGEWRSIRCKEVKPLLWEGGGKRRLLRLIVIAAQPYRTSPNSRVNYRQPSYYLTTDLSSPLELLVQAAFDRWQIEVNHREEKSGFGVGEAQVRSEQSVPRHPAFAVAVYSMMHMSALELFGPTRTDNYLPLPKWRRGARRPSIADLKALLTYESQSHPTNQLHRDQKHHETELLGTIT